MRATRKCKLYCCHCASSWTLCFHAVAVKRFTLMQKRQRALPSTSSCLRLWHQTVKTRQSHWCLWEQWETNVTLLMSYHVPQNRFTVVTGPEQCWGHVLSVAPGQLPILCWSLSRHTSPFLLILANSSAYRSHLSVLFRCLLWQPRWCSLLRMASGCCTGYLMLRLTFTLVVAVNAWLVPLRPTHLCVPILLFCEPCLVERMSGFRGRSHALRKVYRCSKEDVLPKPLWLLAYLMGGQREISCFPWQCTNSSFFPSPNNLFVSVTCIALVFFHGMGLPRQQASVVLGM